MNPTGPGNFQDSIVNPEEDLGFTFDGAKKTYFLLLKDKVFLQL